MPRITVEGGPSNALGADPELPAEALPDQEAPAPGPEAAADAEPAAPPARPPVLPRRPPPPADA